MRGFKAVSFDQLKMYCKYRYVLSGEGAFDGCNDPCTGFTRCLQSTCLPWRKIGRADIKVVKVKSHNSSTTPASK